jgi:hypothetical protein
LRGRVREGVFQFDPVDPHRPDDVLDLLLAEILVGEVELVPYLVTDDPADADPAGLGERFETGRDVDPVAEEVLAPDDDVAQMHPDAEAHLLAGRPGRILLGDPLLDRGRALHRVDGAGDVGDDAVKMRPRWAAIRPSMTAR